jgi:hypothetical protein
VIGVWVFLIWRVGLSKSFNKIILVKLSKNRETFNNIRSALDACKNEEEVMIIGGMSIYAQFLTPSIDKNDLFATEPVPLVDRIWCFFFRGYWIHHVYFCSGFGVFRQL